MDIQLHSPLSPLNPAWSAPRGDSDGLMSLIDSALRQEAGSMMHDQRLNAERAMRPGWKADHSMEDEEYSTWMLSSWGPGTMMSAFPEPLDSDL